MDLRVTLPLIGGILFSGLTGCSSSLSLLGPTPSTQQASQDTEGEEPKNYVETIPGSDVTFEMIWIPEGNFWIGKTEVTWDEYLRYCNFDHKDTLPEGVDAVTRPSRPLETFPYDREWGVGRRPAVGMSWNAAKGYCRWLSLKTGKTYRLPHESEWKVACGPRPDRPLDEIAWYDENSDDKTQEVAQKQPNQYGLYDMLGNLWEYCLDPFDPKEPEWAVLKGGAWADFDEDATPDSRLKFDEFWNMMDSNVPPGVWWVPDGDHLGFRVFRAADPDPSKEERPSP